MYLVGLGLRLLSSFEMFDGTRDLLVVSLSLLDEGLLESLCVVGNRHCEWGSAGVEDGWMCWTR